MYVCYVYTIWLIQYMCTNILREEEKEQDSDGGSPRPRLFLSLASLALYLTRSPFCFVRLSNVPSILILLFLSLSQHVYCDAYIYIYIYGNVPLIWDHHRRLWTALGEAGLLIFLVKTGRATNMQASSQEKKGCANQICFFTSSCVDMSCSIRSDCIVYIRSGTCYQKTEHLIWFVVVHDSWEWIE